MKPQHFLNSMAAHWAGAVREFARSKLYVGLLAAGTLMVVAAATLAELSLGETVNALVDLGMAFVALVVAGLAATVTISSVSTAIASREVVVLLARPVSRDAFVYGRSLAAITLVVSANAVLGVMLATLVAVFGGPALRTFVGIMFASFEGVIVAGLAMTFAVRSSSVLAATLTAVLFVVGRMDEAMAALLEKGTFGALETPMRVLAHLLPQLSRFDLTAWVHGDAPASSLTWAVGYGVLYAGALAAIASYRFSRRDVL